MAGISVAIFFVVLALRELLNRRRPLSAEY